MQSIKSIYMKYFAEKPYLFYMATHKFSQDHLETLFSIIRRMGGYNDNPNCVQFKAAIKRILVQNEPKASFNANCDD